MEEFSSSEGPGGPSRGQWAPEHMSCHRVLPSTGEGRRGLLFVEPRTYTFRGIQDLPLPDLGAHIPVALPSRIQGLARQLSKPCWVQSGAGLPGAQHSPEGGLEEDAGPGR